ncbi:MAG: ABC transporter ATP-binding protein [Geminicoccaceae bacterium]
MRSSGALLSVRDLVGGYRPGLPILHGISIEARPGEVTTIVGPNGAGKSTLIKAVAGFLRLEAGEVTLDGETITGEPPHGMVRRGLAFVPQRDNVFVTLSVRDNLRMGAFTLAGETTRRIDEAYASFPILHERRHSKASVLSGGERQMLAIALALMPRPRCIMLDEPTAGLAPRVVVEVLERVRDLARTGVTVLMVEQNAKAAL